MTTEWATIPTNSGDAAVIMDPEQEQSLEEIPDDASQPSYREEEPISTARNTSLPPRQRHWMDTTLRTRMRAGGIRRYYLQFAPQSTRMRRHQMSSYLVPKRKPIRNRN